MLIISGGIEWQNFAGLLVKWRAHGCVVGEGVVFVDDTNVGKYSAWMMLSWRYGDDVAMTDVCGQRSCELISFYLTWRLKSMGGSLRPWGLGLSTSNTALQHLFGPLSTLAGFLKIECSHLRDLSASNWTRVAPHDLLWRSFLWSSVADEWTPLKNGWHFSAWIS